MRRQTVITTLVLALVLAGIGGADYWFRERPRQVIAGEKTIDPQTGTGASQGMSSSRRIVKKGTRKKEIESVDAILARTGFTLQDTRELPLIKLATPAGDKVKSGSLLFNNDRAALIAWIDDPDVKTFFLDLKQSLQKGFSAQVHDVIDDRVVPEDGAPMDILSFTDPAISNEKIIILRVRTRLIEIHVAPGKDAAVNTLINELSR